jgi:hypothetical protein
MQKAACLIQDKRPVKVPGKPVTAAVSQLGFPSHMGMSKERAAHNQSGTAKDPDIRI